jgi:hypothetical protein
LYRILRRLQENSFFVGQNKKPLALSHGRFFISHIPLHSAGDLTGTEASGADVDVSGGAIHDCLNPLHVGLPGAVGAAVGVGNLDAEGHALVAKFAFGHVAYLLAMRNL